jgi:hypothetical protein
MEIMESNVKMIKSQKESGNDLGMENTRQTSEPVVRFVLKPVTQASPTPIFSSGFSTGPNVSQEIETPKATEPVSEPVNEVWGNGLGIEINKPIAQVAPIFSSGFSTGPNVSQEIETPKASNFQPVSEPVKEVWGNGLGMEFIKPTAQAAPIFSSGFTEQPLVSQEFETPKATKPQFEPASEPFSLDDVIMENLIKNADVIIGESFSTIGESSVNVPLVQNNFGNPMETVSHHMDLKTIDPKVISSPSRYEPENLNKVDNFNIFHYMNVWNDSPQID